MGEMIRDNRSADEIRRDIEGTRSDLHRTVNMLERKLSVGQIVDEIWNRVGGRRTFGSTASSFGDTVRDNPVPLALMGLGVAWLAVDRATGSRTDGITDRRSGTGTYARAEGRVGPYRGDAVHESGPSAMESAKDRARSAADRARSSASGIAETVKEKASSAADMARRTASDAKERMGSSDSGGDGVTDHEGSGFGTRMWESAGDTSRRAGDMTHRAGDMAGRARHEARHTARRAKSGLRTAMDEQPLALGAVAFGLGLASGLAAPTTRWEDRTMGDASDQLKHEAGSRLHEAAEDAKQVVRDTAAAAKEEADRQGIGENLKEAGRSIATEAKETAKERMREKGLTPDEMKQRASVGDSSTSGSGTPGSGTPGSSGEPDTASSGSGTADEIRTSSSTPEQISRRTTE